MTRIASRLRANRSVSGTRGRERAFATRSRAKLPERDQGEGFRDPVECKGADCSDLGGSELYFALHDESPLGNGDIHSTLRPQIFTSAKLTRPEGDVYATIYVGDFKKAPEVLVDVVETAPMDTDKIVFVDAAQMQRDIALWARRAIRNSL